METTSVFVLPASARLAEGEASLATGPGDALPLAASEPAGAGDAPLGSGDAAVVEAALGEAALDEATLGEAEVDATAGPPPPSLV